MTSPAGLLDIEAWRTWRQSPDTNTTGAVLDRIEPIVNTAIRSHMRGGITGGTMRVPPVVIKSKAQTMALKHLQAYDPDLSQINTYLTNYLHRNLAPWLNKYQNLVRIPSGKSDHISKVKNAEAELEVDLGRPPSDADIAARIKLPEHHVEAIRYQTGQKDYLASRAEIEAAVDDSPLQRAMRQTYAELPSQHRAVFDLWLKQDKPSSHIRNMMNLSRDQLSKIQGRIRSDMSNNHTQMG